jgi:hypothetical protein
MLGLITQTGRHILMERCLTKNIIRGDMFEEYQYEDEVGPEFFHHHSDQYLFRAVFAAIPSYIKRKGRGGEHVDIGYIGAWGFALCHHVAQEIRPELCSTEG